MDEGDILFSLLLDDYIHRRDNIQSVSSPPQPPPPPPPHGLSSLTLQYQSRTTTTVASPAVQLNIKRTPLGENNHIYHSYPSLSPNIYIPQHDSITINSLPTTPVQVQQQRRRRQEHEQQQLQQRVQNSFSIHHDNNRLNDDNIDSKPQVTNNNTQSLEAADTSISTQNHHKKLCHQAKSPTIGKIRQQRSILRTPVKRRLTFGRIPNARKLIKI